MKIGSHILFPPFQLDLANARLWRGEQLVVLRPKTFAVLCHLVENAGRLVSKKDLLAAVWPDTRVSEVGLKDYVQEIRKALGDDAKVPRFIETVPRRGYCFIAPITVSPQLVSSSSHPVPSTKHPALPLAGREAELQQLHDWLEQATGGERQIIFVTGEPGIGKTTLVDTFVVQVEAGLRAGLASGQSQRDAPTALWPDIWIGRGQCSEHYGAGEAYLPVLEALGRLCREPGGQQLVWLLSRYAPTWLVQMPWLVSETDRDELQHRVLGATPGRMLRETAELLEVLTVEKLLVLVLEDLQWSDYSTLDLLAFLARRPEPARLLVIGTYRPADAERNEHPLRTVKQELQTHGHCQELALAPLTEEGIAHYLTARFAVAVQSTRSLRELARPIHQRTEGNPLFMVNVVDYLVAQGVMVERGGQWELKGKIEKIVAEVPANLRQMIEEQIGRLSAEEQHVLEVASVVGAEFSAATVAAGLGIEVVAGEEQCAQLARRGQFLRSHGVEEWPDGTAAGRYGFLHALYQNVVYEQLTAGQQLHLHRRIGERKEAGYGRRAGEIAAELAVHFEQGRDYGRAVQYLRQAGENAHRRYAYREALGYVNKGLELLEMLPYTSERVQHELALQASLGMSLSITNGYAASEAESAYTRALELCQQIGETSWLLRVLAGLFDVYLVQGKLRAAYETGEKMLSLVREGQDLERLAWAHVALGIASRHLGELALARAHLEQGLILYDPHKHRAALGVACLCYLAFTLLALGYADQALKKIQEALALAEEQSDPHSLAYALAHLALYHLSFEEGRSAQQRAEAAIALAAEQGFTHWSALGTMARGAALAQQGRLEEGIAQMRQGLAAHQATGGETARPWFLALLVEGYSRADQVEEGLSVLAEALDVAHKIEDRAHEAELYRLKGELTLKQSGVRRESRVGSAHQESSIAEAGTVGGAHPTVEAEAYFLKAIAIARRQEGKSLELRAAMSLARLWQSQGKKKEARQLLAEIYGWFTEGFATKDLQEARALLQELSGE